MYAIFWDIVGGIQITMDGKVVEFMFQLQKKINTFLIHIS